MHRLVDPPCRYDIKFTECTLKHALKSALIMQCIAVISDTICFQFHHHIASEHVMGISCASTFCYVGLCDLFSQDSDHH